MTVPIFLMRKLRPETITWGGPRVAPCCLHLATPLGSDPLPLPHSTRE